MEFLIADQRGDGLLVLLGNTAIHQLVQDREHFFFHQAPAFKEDLADGKNLTIGKDAVARIFQTIAAFSPVINHGLSTTDAERVFLIERPKVINISLDGPLIDLKIAGRGRLIDHFAGVQNGVKGENTIIFGLLRHGDHPFIQGIL